MLLAIDPGVDTGWATFNGERRLTGCGLSRAGANPPPLEGLSRVTIECPALRPRGEKNPNAILKVARSAGEWAGRCYPAEVVYVTPNQWKGTLPKSVSHARMWAKLDEKEKSIVDKAFKQAPGRNGLAPGLRHNVLDAIGIGLFSVGR